jgi:hypothetical protein
MQGIDVPDSLRDETAANLVSKFFQLRALARVGNRPTTLDSFDAECFAIIESEVSAQGKRRGAKGG